MGLIIPKVVHISGEYCPYCKSKDMKLSMIGKLVKRVNRKSGEKFLGCTNYPVCKFTQKVDLRMEKMKNGEGKKIKYNRRKIK